MICVIKHLKGVKYKCPKIKYTFQNNKIKQNNINIYNFFFVTHTSHISITNFNIL